MLASSKLRKYTNKNEKELRNCQLKSWILLKRQLSLLATSLINCRIQYESMNYGNRTLAGTLLFLGSVVYVLGTISGERLFESMNVYNLSVVLLGIFMIAGAYFLQRAFKSVVFSLLVAIAGVCALGVGLLVGNPSIYHPVAAVGYITFGLSAIVSYKFAKAPFSYFCVALGAISLIFFAVWAYSGATTTSLTTDFSQLLWLAGFAAHIIAEKE